MGFKLECEKSISAKDATESDINRAFDDDHGRGQFVILTTPSGDSFIQAAHPPGEDEGPYILEYSEGEKQFEASSELSKEEVRKVFLTYLSGNDAWRSKYTWKELELKKGCLGSVLLLVGSVVTVAYAI